MTVGVKVVLLVETSKPLGGVTRIPDTILLPETLNEVEVEAVP